MEHFTKNFITIISTTGNISNELSTTFHVELQARMEQAEG